MADLHKCSLEELSAALRRSWMRETAAPGSQNAWSATNPAWGQCAVTALIVHDLFGGEILRTEVPGYGSHYYNRLADGREIDLTREQFPADVTVPPGQSAPRERLLSSDRARAAQTEERYRRLAQRLFEEMS